MATIIGLVLVIAIIICAYVARGWNISAKTALLGMMVGAILGGFCLTLWFILVASPESAHEAGIGYSIFVLFGLLPLNAAIGAYFGVAVAGARAIARSGNARKAGWICVGAGGIVAGLYALLYAFTGFPGPASMHHMSAVYGEWSSRAQDVSDALSYCGPLGVALLFMALGAMTLLIDANLYRPEPMP